MAFPFGLFFAQGDYVEVIEGLIVVEECVVAVYGVIVGRIAFGFQPYVFVHKEVEDYYNHGKPTLSSSGAKWVVEELFYFEDKIADNSSKDKVISVESEVMVSDFIATASKVDIVMRTLEGKAYLFDIKTTSKFDREYCSYQLSVYKKLYEQCYNEKVAGLYVLGTKSHRAFRIIEQSKERVDRVLKINKELLGIKEE